MFFSYYHGKHDWYVNVTFIAIGIYRDADQEDIRERAVSHIP